jgi:uncharacterized membrane protein HdeD (DUF308 family)
MNAMVRKSNPFRSDAGWVFVLVEAIVAIIAGIYLLRDEQSARRTIVFLIGLFLLLNGLEYAFKAIKSRSSSNVLSQFELIRAGIGIATGAIIVINRIVEFMGVNPSRVVAGIGLAGIGAASLWGAFMARDDAPLRAGALISAALFILWGVVTLYQASNDTSHSNLYGWVAIIAGVALIGLAYLRRQQTLRPRPAAKNP